MGIGPGSRSGGILYRSSFVVGGRERHVILNVERVAGEFIGGEDDAVCRCADTNCRPDQVFERGAHDHRAAATYVDGRLARVPAMHGRIGEPEEAAIALPHDGLAEAPPKGCTPHSQLHAAVSAHADLELPIPRVRDVQIGDDTRPLLRRGRVDTHIDVIKVDVRELTVARTSSRAAQPEADVVAKREDILHHLPVCPLQVKAHTVVGLPHKRGRTERSKEVPEVDVEDCGGDRIGARSALGARGL